MTHFGECAALGISASKCADINLEPDINFDFGTNTGRALEIAKVTSPEQLAEEFPDIASKVFPTDPNTGEILAYRPQKDSLIESLEGFILANPAVCSEQYPCEGIQKRYLINPVEVDERENLDIQWFSTMPVEPEPTGETSKTVGLIENIKNKYLKLSTKQKAAGAVALGVVLF